MGASREKGREDIVLSGHGRQVCIYYIYIDIYIHTYIYIYIHTHIHKMGREGQLGGCRDLGASREEGREAMVLTRRILKPRAVPIRYRARFQDNCFSVLRRGSKEVSYLRLVHFCITHL